MSGSSSTSILDLLDRGLTSFNNFKMDELRRDLLEAETKQSLSFRQVERDSNVNAQTQTPVFLVGQSTTEPMANNDMLLLLAAAAVAFMVLK